MKEYLSVKQLRNWDDNPREITKEGFARLKKQIKKYNRLLNPLKVCKGSPVLPDGTVLGGNMRLRALRDLKIDKAWVDYHAPKTIAEALELSLTDNDRAGYYNEDQTAEIIFKYKNEFNIADYAVDFSNPLSLLEVVNSVSPSMTSDDIQEHWRGMPEFKIDELMDNQIIITFRNNNDRVEFGKLVKQKITEKTKSIWFPEKERNVKIDKRY